MSYAKRGIKRGRNFIYALRLESKYQVAPKKWHSTTHSESFLTIAPKVQFYYGSIRIQGELFEICYRGIHCLRIGYVNISMYAFQVIFAYPVLLSVGQELGRFWPISLICS